MMAGKDAGYVPKVLSRRRPPTTGDEEVGATLKLGEFEGVSCLSVSEAHTLLSRIAKVRNEQYQKTGTAALPNSDVYNKTRDYLQKFARFSHQNAVQQVEAMSQTLVDSGHITMFEKAQLGTLCCEDADEAKTLIPSLEGKLTDEDLQQVLDEITKLRDFN